MDSKFDREQNLKERLNFIRYYAKWVKTVPNEIWSKQQAEFIDSLFDNSKNFSLTPEKYLKTIRR
jgi:hypothetical protein